jgi:glutamyl-tRNA synthetase
MKPVGKGKLSKRDGDKMGFPVFPIQWETKEGEVFSGYREDGYFPETVINMLALLGWNPGTEQEIFSLSELVESFDLDRINKAGAKFDPEKTKWFQHHYLQVKDNKTLTSLFSKLLENKGIVTNNDISIIVASIKERATFVNDLWEQGNFFFEAPTEYDEKASKKVFKEGTCEIMTKVLGLLNECNEFTSDEVSRRVKEWLTSQEIGFGKVMMPLRLSLVGEMKGPDVFDIAAILGKKETISRIQKTISFLS